MADTPTIITERALRRITESAPEGSNVVSLYIDLDPSAYATAEARSSQLTSLLDEANKQGAADETLTRLKDTFERELPAGNAAALAVFAADDWLEIVKLPHNVQPVARVDSSPYLEPLAELIAHETWLVAMVGRRAMRILRGTPGVLRELRNDEDDVQGQHSAGGWSQARFERSVEKDVDDHYKNVAGIIETMYRAAPFDRLLIVCNEEDQNRVRSALHPEVAQRLVETIDMEIENSTVEQVRDRLGEIAEIYDTRREKETIERLSELLATEGRAEQGWERVLSALNEQRVDTLLYQPGIARPGVACPRCGFIAVSAGSTCPVDETPLEQRDNILDDAIERAVLQSSEVRAVRHHDLESLGVQESIAALTRY